MMIWEHFTYTIMLVYGRSRIRNDLWLNVSPWGERRGSRWRMFCSRRRFTPKQREYPLTRQPGTRRPAGDASAKRSPRDLTRPLLPFRMTRMDFPDSSQRNHDEIEGNLPAVLPAVLLHNYSCRLLTPLPEASEPEPATRQHRNGSPAPKWLPER